MIPPTIVPRFQHKDKRPTLLLIRRARAKNHRLSVSKVPLQLIAYNSSGRQASKNDTEDHEVWFISSELREKKREAIREQPVSLDKWEGAIKTRGGRIGRVEPQGRQFQTRWSLCWRQRRGHRSELHCKKLYVTPTRARKPVAKGRCSGGAHQGGLTLSLVGMIHITIPTQYSLMTSWRTEELRQV